MVKYLVIQLDDTSVSFCHYSNTKTERKLIPLEILREAIFHGLKENVIFQFVYPEYDLPTEYYQLIDSVYHADIVPSSSSVYDNNKEDNIIVLNNLNSNTSIDVFKNKTIVVRSSLSNLIEHKVILSNLLTVVERLTIVITTTEDYKDFMNEDYSSLLKYLANVIKEEYFKRHYVQLNLLTDRLFLKEMNNCSAGHESITLCPDGKYYPCPAFYFHNDNYSLGDVKNGVSIRNAQLYRVDHAPICKLCDCWQCKRCVWLNQKLTREINTPSHQQCVLSHLEREASRNLLTDIREIGNLLSSTNIDKLDYLDPFDLLV